MAAPALLSQPQLGMHGSTQSAAPHQSTQSARDGVHWVGVRGGLLHQEPRSNLLGDEVLGFLQQLLGFEVVAHAPAVEHEVQSTLSISVGGGFRPVLREKRLKGRDGARLRLGRGDGHRSPLCAQPPLLGTAAPYSTTCLPISATPPYGRATRSAGLTLLAVQKRVKGRPRASRCARRPVIARSCCKKTGPASYWNFVQLF
jgi:hypothetical protein